MKKIFQQSVANLRAVALAYAIVIFSGSPWVGCLLAGASLLSPWTGLTGLVGTIIALITARRAGFERAAVDDGRLLFNSLLCSLALGFWAPPGALAPLVFAFLLVMVSVGALGCTLLLNQVTLILVGTASRSVAYCVVATGLHWLLTRIIPAAVATSANGDAIAQIQLPAVVEWWARSLGTIFFAPSILAGLIVTLALLLTSRLSLLHALAGYAVSAIFLQALGFPLAQAYWLQLDAILCAVALGGVFFVPSRGAFVLAALGAGLCTVLGVALTQGLRSMDVPVLTLPFNLVVLGVSGVLRWRAPGCEPRAVLYPGKTPEATFQADRLWAARHPEPDLPAIAPPFDGEWVVTQGFDDELTHRDSWRHALDFELANANHEADRPDSAILKDFPTFDAPIISPADGRVVRLVSDVVDNAIGDSNLVENWGNSIVIEIAPGLHVQLSHFRRHGFKVREGDRVRQGQLLGYLGNSGRSPVPHLHMQMQVLPEIGSPTIPFRLRAYRTPVEGGHWNYHFSGLPRQGDVIAGCRRAPWMQECFAPGATSERAYRVFTSRGEETETIVQEWTPGLLVLRSKEKGARLQLTVNEGMLTPAGFGGSPRSLLAVFSAGGRIPLAPGGDCQWQDFTDPATDSNIVRRFYHDLVGPFMHPPLAPCQAQMISCDAQNRQFGVRWVAPNQSVAELHFTAGLGLTSGRMETRRDWLRFLALDVDTPDQTSVPARAQNPQPIREFALI